jgi:hypothetical protein
VRSVLDQALLVKIRSGRLRDDGWPYGLGAVVGVGAGLFALTVLLALFGGSIRSWSELTVPNSLTSSVPDALVWVLVFLLAFCLALLTTAALHGPWWLSVLGLLSVALLLGAWSVATATTRGVPLAVGVPLAALAVIVALLVTRRRRGLAWWEFPAVLGVIGTALGLSLQAFASSDRLLGFRFAPVFLDQTLSLLTFLVLPAAFAAGAAVAEIAVGLTLVATRTAQRLSAGRWPYVVLAAVLLLRLTQEGLRLSDLDPVESGWIAVLPAIGLAAAFAAIGWLISRLTPLAGVPVAALPDDLSRIAVPVGAAVIAMLLPVYVFLFGFQIAVGLNPAAAPAGFDPSPLVDRLVDGFRIVLGLLLIGLALWQARRGRGGLALVLGGSGLMLTALGVRLLTGYRWALWVDPDALVSVVTVVVLVAGVGLLLRRALSRDRAIGLAAVLALAVLLSVRSVIVDPFGVLLGYGGVAFVLFGVTWDFLTGSDWANTDGRRVSRPVRVLLALGYPLLTVTIVAADALIRRPRTFSDVNAFAELGELVLGTALLGAAVVVVLSAVRTDRDVG